MSDFMGNGASELPGVKTDLRPASGATSEWAAEDANDLRQAALDLRSGLLTEITSRVNTDLAIIASGATPSNVNLSPVIATGSTTARAIADRFAEVMNVKDFGGVGDGSTDCDAALIAAATAAGNVGVVRFPFVDGAANVYRFNAFYPWTFSGVTFDVDSGVVLSTPGDEVMAPTARTLRFERPTKFYWRSLGRYYVVSASGLISGSVPAPTKDLWIDDAALDRSNYSAIPCNTSQVAATKILWNSSDTWDSDAFASSAADNFRFTPGSVDSNFHVGLYSVLPGDEIMAAFEVAAGSPYLVALIRTTGGMHGIFATADDVATSIDEFSKATGVNGTSGAAGYIWKGNNAAYAPKNAVWSIRVEAWNRVSILANGFPLQTFSATNGYIVSAGFGIYPRTASDSVYVRDLVVARRKAPTYGNFVSVKVFGDSRTAPRYDCWPDHLQTALEFTAGIRNWKVINSAVAGDGSGDQLTDMTSQGVADADIVVVDVGTNDVQSLASLSTYLSNVGSMISLCLTAGKPIVLVNFDLWYTQGQAGATGQASANYEAGALYRSGLIRLAALNGLKLIDSPSVSGPVVANYVNAALGTDMTDAGDPYLSDNIHPTTLANRLRAREVARSIAGYYLPANACMKLPNVALAQTSNGWAVTTQAPYATIDASGTVTMDGLVNDPGGATRTDGATFLTLPLSIRPQRTKRFKVYSATISENPMVLVDAVTGEMKIYGLSAGTYFSLDSITYNIDPRVGYGY